MAIKMGSIVEWDKLQAPKNMPVLDTYCNLEYLTVKAVYLQLLTKLGK